MIEGFQETLNSFYDYMEDMNAGYMSVVGKKRSDGEAVAATVFLRGEGTQEILDAIDEIYDRQSQEALEAKNGED